jgi:hypothetical protein
MPCVGFEPTDTVSERAKTSCLRPRNYCDRPRGNLLPDNVTANPGRRTNYNAGQKHKHNIHSLHDLWWTKWRRAGFLRVLRFPLPKPFIPPTSPSSQSPGAGTIGQEWPQCRVDPVWTPSPTIQIRKYIYISYIHRQENFKF